jgi:hypothetical protein
MLTPVETQLSFAEWVSYAGVHPMHAHGISLAQSSENRGALPGCKSIWFSKDYQTADGLSRFQIMRAIRSAEDDIEQHLGYRLTPSWTSERVEPVRYYRPEFGRYGIPTYYGGQYPFTARWGQFLYSGARATEPINEGLAVTWTTPDPFLPSWKQWGQVTFPNVTAIDGLTAGEMHVYYAGHGGDPLYEIRPIEVTIGVTDTVIRFRRELCAILEREESYAILPGAFDGSLDDQFVTTVDVWRVYNDPSQAATAYWRNPTCGCSGDSSCPTCSYRTGTACLTASDPVNGMLSWSPASYADGSWTLGCPADWTQPNYLEASYYGGSPLIAGKMNPFLARLVMLLSISRLDRPGCSCSGTYFGKEQEDLAVAGGGVSRFYSPRALGCPWGTRRGAVEAWGALTSYPDIRQNRGAVTA